MYSYSDFPANSLNLSSTELRLTPEDILWIENRLFLSAFSTADLAYHFIHYSDHLIHKGTRTGSRPLVAILILEDADE